MTENSEAIDLEEDTQHGKYLIFALGKEMFGIKIQFVTEIVGMQKIVGLPEAPDYVKGVINLRGIVIPVIDMGSKLGKTQAEYTNRTCIVVIEIMELSVGLIVDRVEEVITIPDESIVPPPNFRSGFQNNYIDGIGKVEKEIRLLLNCERLFGDEEIQSLNRMNAGSED